MIFRPLHKADTWRLYFAAINVDATSWRLYNLALTSINHEADTTSNYHRYVLTLLQRHVNFDAKSWLYIDAFATL